MYVVLVAGFVLWLGYGVTLGSWPIVAFNAANLVLSAAILRLKLRDGKGAGLGRVAAVVGSTEARPWDGRGRCRSRSPCGRTSGPAAVGARPHPGRPEAEPAARPDPLTTARVRVAVTDWGAAFHSQQRNEFRMSTRLETGACFCGAVAAEMGGYLFWICYDHDDDCRRAIGSPLTIWIGYRPSEFRLTEEP